VFGSLLARTKYADGTHRKTFEAGKPVCRLATSRSTTQTEPSTAGSTTFGQTRM
jgi:hypothetical protein